MESLGNVPSLKKAEKKRENKIKDADIQTWPIICDNKNTILGIPSLKKSKFCKDKSEKYDIIINCKEKK